MPFYVAEMIKAVQDTIEKYANSVESLPFIDPNLVIQELIMKTMKPQSIAVLINCDWFEELTPDNFNKEHFRSLFERFCWDHNWVPARLSLETWPAADKPENYLFFHGMFKEEEN